MSIILGELEEADLARGFLETMEGLGRTELTPKEARVVLEARRGSGARTFVAREGGRTIGTATLLIEHKFTHRGGRAGHLEDVVVHPDYQGQGLGAMLVRHAIEQAKALGCYKVILNCTDQVMPFYSRLGFRRHENGMRMDLQE